MLLRSRSMYRALALAPALTSVSLLLAGGFFLTLGNPAASRDGKHLAYAVADTRIPDHTIWHHNSVASAFASAARNGRMSLTATKRSSTVS